MGKIIILPETTKNPITLIGKRAGVCWGSDISDNEKNYKRGMECIMAQHGRTLEYVNVEMIIDGYSARVIREFYTHIGGAPTRLQASTRYINYNDFNYIVPKSIKNSKDNEAWELYSSAIRVIKQTCANLENIGLPREDIAMLLPLGMTTKIVDKRNLRNLIDMSHQRMCTRAYWEYRELFNDICVSLSKVSNEWKWIVDNLFKPKCEVLGYCLEKKSCGRKENEIRNSN
jgi:thymidylate synthase (FAD)